MGQAMLSAHSTWLKGFREQLTASGKPAAALPAGDGVPQQNGAMAEAH